MIKTYAYKDIKIDEIFAREEEKTTIADVVSEIIADVRKNGDTALKAYCEKFDGAAADVLIFVPAGGEHQIAPRDYFAKGLDVSFGVNVDHVTRKDQKRVLLFRQLNGLTEILIGIKRRLAPRFSERVIPTLHQLPLKIGIGVGGKGQVHVCHVKHLYGAFKTHFDHCSYDLLHLFSPFDIFRKEKYTTPPRLCQ